MADQRGRSAERQADRRDPVQEFLDYMRKTPEERYREALAAAGLPDLAVWGIPIFDQGQEFQRREAFLAIADAEPERCYVVNAGRSPQAVHSDIAKIVRRYFAVPNAKLELV